MGGQLPRAPASLAGPPRDFYDELLEMLAVVAPTRLDAGKSSVRFDDDGLELHLAHTEREDWSIWANVGDRDAIIGPSWTHEHFSPRDGANEERPWTTQMVDFIAELLRGQIEVETTFRGNTPVVVRHFNRDEQGQRVLLGHTGFLVPGRLAVWKPKRTVSDRVSFL
jgi:hypothetical protein